MIMVFHLYELSPSFNCYRINKEFFGMFKVTLFIWIPKL